MERREWHGGLAGLQVAAGALLLLSGVACASEEAPRLPLFALDYQRGNGAERCPTAEDFQKGVLKHLGHDPFSEAGPGHLSVELSQEEAGLAASVTLRRDPTAAPGERVLRSKELDCVVLASTLELVVSLDIEAQEQAAETPAITAAAVPHEGAKHVPFLVALGPMVVFLAAPSTTLGGLLGIEARWPTTSLGLEGRADLFASGSSAGVGTYETSLALVSLVGCAYRTVLGACLLLAAGVESARGLDIPGAQSDSGPYVAPGARLLWDIPLSGTFSLRAQGDVLIPVVRSSLQFGDSQQVWLSPPISFALGLMLQARVL